MADGETGDAVEQQGHQEQQEQQEQGSLDSRLDCGGAVEDGEKMSKRRAKKLKKLEMRKMVTKDRRKEERDRRKKRWESGEGPPPRKRFKRKGDEGAAVCEGTVVIDMSFDQYMSEKDCKRALCQIQYCYSANRRSPRPIHLYVTSLDGKSGRIFDSTKGASNWEESRIELKGEDYAQLFPDKDRLVYLSSESPNVLKEFEEEKVYVIGGLVDHNAHKGLCHRLAEQKGLSHARLPIDEHVEMKTRRVLTINHVFEIMLKYKETRDWEKAFFQVIPKRKRAQKKEDQ